MPDSLRLLVVEDNADALYLVCEMLDALGHKATPAADAIEAQKLLDLQPFDVLFTDVNMPGISGVALAREALKAHPSLKVVFASGFGGGVSDDVEFKSASLAKPYDMDQLEKVLKGL